LYSSVRVRREGEETKVAEPFANAEGYWRSIVDVETKECLLKKRDWERNRATHHNSEAGPNGRRKSKRRRASRSQIVKNKKKCGAVGRGKFWREAAKDG